MLDALNNYATLLYAWLHATVTQAQHAALDIKRDGLSSFADNVDAAVARSPGTTVVHNLAAGAIMLLVVLIIVLLAALVGGEFADAIPANSTFSESINTTTENAGTAFTIFGVSLLAIPAVAVLAYIITRLGGFFGAGGGGMGGLGR